MQQIPTRASRGTTMRTESPLSSTWRGLKRKIQRNGQSAPSSPFMTDMAEACALTTWKTICIRLLLTRIASQKTREKPYTMDAYRLRKGSSPWLTKGVASISLVLAPLSSLQSKRNAISPTWATVELSFQQTAVCECLIYPRTTGQTKKLSFIEFKIMVVKFTRLKHSKMYQLPISLAKSQEHSDRCCMDPIEFYLVDWVCPEHSETLKLS